VSRRTPARIRPLEPEFTLKLRLLGAHGKNIASPDMQGSPIRMVEAPRRALAAYGRAYAKPLGRGPRDFVDALLTPEMGSSDAPSASKSPRIGRLTNSLVYQYDTRTNRRGRQHETVV
jgi:hypothetical protein